MRTTTASLKTWWASLGKISLGQDYLFFDNMIAYITTAPQIGDLGEERVEVKYWTGSVAEELVNGFGTAKGI